MAPCAWAALNLLASVHLCASIAVSSQEVTSPSLRAVQGPIESETDGPNEDNYDPQEDDDSTLGGGLPDAVHTPKPKEQMQEPLSTASSGSTGLMKECRQPTVGSTPFGKIQIGTPWKASKVVFDTGSEKLVTKTWTTVQYQLEKLEPGLVDEVAPSVDIYDSAASKSYTKLMANKSSGGGSMDDPPIALGGDGSATKQQKSVVTYGSGSVELLDGLDNVLIGEQDLKSFPLSEITADTLRMLHSEERVSGILGLQHMRMFATTQPDKDSVFTRARRQGYMEAFSYCRGVNNDGIFIWGDREVGGLQVPVIGNIHWAVNLSLVTFSGGKSYQDDSEDTAREGSGMVVLAETLSGNAPQVPEPDNGNQVQEEESDEKEQDLKDIVKQKLKGILDKIVDEVSADIVAKPKAPEVHCGNEQKCVAVIDTGSNIIALPSRVLKHFAKLHHVKRDCSNLGELPDLNFSMGGFDFSLPASAYVMQLHLNARDKDSTMHSTLVREDAKYGNRGLSWHRSFHKLREERGIDLFASLHHTEQDLRGLDQDVLMCMPALVPLDVDVPKMGDLWIIGSPLFEKYHVRWSWKGDEAAPSIFVEELQTAKACAASDSSMGKNLLRKELDGRGALIEHKRPQLSMGLDEIRFPHWATHAPLV